VFQKSGLLSCVLCCSGCVRVVAMGVTVYTSQVETGTAVSVHDMKVNSGVEAWLHLFITPTLGVDK
jgi:hypothetical protein